MTSAFDRLPVLPTMGVGSYAAPGWFGVARRMMRAGEFGARDAEEALEDATRVVVGDQLDAGVDILTDGELRRQRFVYELYDRVAGLERRPPRRRLGVPGYDMAPSFVARGAVKAETGLGTVAEFQILQRLAPGRPLKIAIPGPLTFAGAIDPGGREPAGVLDDLVAMVSGELRALAEAGADCLQLDEPGLAAPPYGLSFEDGAGAINRALDGVPGRRAVHVCFGNNAGRPMAHRRMAPLIPAVRSLSCEQLVLEFANREMADIELLADLAESFDIAAGVVDVKSFYLEPPELIAERIERCLEFVPADRLTVTADCGFSALPRHLARDKQMAMVAGARLVRDRIGAGGAAR